MKSRKIVLIRLFVGQDREADIENKLVDIYICVCVCVCVCLCVYYVRASLVAQLVKNLLAMQETLLRFLRQEDSLEKG